MIITIAGLHGTGKTTIAKKLGKNFNFMYFSTGMAFRELAKEKNMSLEEFSKYSEDNFEVDKGIDSKIIKLAKTGDNYVFDGQMPTHMLKDLKDFSILLTCDNDVRIRRMSERDNNSIEDKKHETLVREKSEQQRFIDIYNIDILDPKTILQSFNLIIDTTILNIDEILKICTSAIEGILRASKI